MIDEEFELPYNVKLYLALSQNQPRITMPQMTIMTHEGIRRPEDIDYEGAFVKLLNKEMEELLKNIENNKELKKLYENNSTNSKGVENENETN